MTRQKWTPAEVKKLREMREGGKSISEIADELGRSYDSVNSAFSHRFKKISPSAFPVWDAPLTTQGDAHVLGATIVRGGYPFVLCPESPWEMLKRM